MRRCTLRYVDSTSVTHCSTPPIVLQSRIIHHKARSEKVQQEPAQKIAELYLPPSSSNAFRASSIAALVTPDASCKHASTHCCWCRRFLQSAYAHLPAVAKELAVSSKSLRLAAIPSIGRPCITATLLPVLENGDCEGTVKSGAPDPAYPAPAERSTMIMASCNVLPHASTHVARLTMKVCVYSGIVQEQIGQRRPIGCTAMMEHTNNHGASQGEIE